MKEQEWEKLNFAGNKEFCLNNMVCVNRIL